VIRLVVMVFVKFPLSLRNVEDLLHERGIDISYETGPLLVEPLRADVRPEIRKKRVDYMRGHTHRKWHLDEMYVKIKGVTYYLWRAVDHEDEVLESFATKERDMAAALKFMKKLMKRHGTAKKVTTDGLRSYKAAMKQLGNVHKQLVGRWANNRVENSHQPCDHESGRWPDSGG
jgi:putative transposase